MSNFEALFIGHRRDPHWRNSSDKERADQDPRTVLLKFTNFPCPIIRRGPSFFRLFPCRPFVHWTYRIMVKNLSSCKSTSEGFLETVF